MPMERCRPRRRRVARTASQQFFRVIDSIATPRSGGTPDFSPRETRHVAWVSSVGDRELTLGRQNLPQFIYCGRKNDGIANPAARMPKDACALRALALAHLMLSKFLVVSQSCARNKERPMKRRHLETS
jgi:hypothetical protein